MKTKISFVGGGNIARAICAGLVKRGGFEICAAEIDGGNRRRLKSAFGDAIAVVARARDLPQNPTAFVLAVKPQDAEAACADLTPTAGATVVSVAAGIRIAALSRWLGGRGKIARAMPNTPALVGCGMTFCCAPGLDAKARALTTRIFKTSGAVEWLAEESLLDCATAVSGSGPGYVFYLLEAVESAAARMGMDTKTARAAFAQTLRGAAQMVEESGETPRDLRLAVTSKGGTTEAAIAELKKRDFAAAVAAAMQKCARRARQMSDEFK